SNIPADTLTRRPDIMQAEEALKAANARISAARAAYFPDISLTASAGYVSTKLSSLASGSSGTWGVGANLFQTVFDAGKTRAMNEQAEAEYRRLLAMYEKTVQEAYKDVYDSLNASRSKQLAYAALSRQVKALERGYLLSIDKYLAGLISTTDLLDVKRGWLAAQMGLSAAQYDRIAATVSVVRSLGGGWEAPKTNRK
ncbi:MAG: TolC family protein, partial [Alphaproteobacteria bacterium]|nr:TolC family protein [Alphaproteobacteria bacterium]